VGEGAGTKAGRRTRRAFVVVHAEMCERPMEALFENIA
jgi:hypothetical protein